MAGPNLFLPIFDSIYDSFESLRRRSSLCLSAILTVASRPINNSNIHDNNIHAICQADSQNLAAESLFRPHGQLESVQGMIVLAAYSEKTWLAIGHAYHMAVDLGLDKLVQINHRKDKNMAHGDESGVLARKLRTWLILHHIDQEIASGTARESRTMVIEEKYLRGLLEYPLSSAFDLRIISTIEVVQLRSKFFAGVYLGWVPILTTLVNAGRLIEQISRLYNVHEDSMEILEAARTESHDWFIFWDKLYESMPYYYSLVD